MTKPILFNTEMVRAILDGRKTVTRRVIKNNISDIKQFGNQIEFKQEYSDGTIAKTRMSKNAFADTYAPYHEGDFLYVRETWAKIPGASSKGGFVYKYRASEEGDYWNKVKGFKWNPSIHMPKEAARIYLIVTSVQIRRLKDMTIEDVHKEGIDIHTDAVTDGETLKSHHDFSFEKFEALWDETISKKNLKTYGFNANPYVWVIEFKKTENTDK